MISIFLFLPIRNVPQKRLLQDTRNKLENWAKEKGKFPYEKAMVVKFNKRKVHIPPKLLGEQRRVIESTLYLSLIIDSCLS